MGDYFPLGYREVGASRHYVGSLWYLHILLQLWKMLTTLGREGGAAALGVCVQSSGPRGAGLSDNPALTQASALAKETV